MLSQAEEGLCHGGRPPFGYERDKNRKGLVLFNVRKTYYFVFGCRPKTDSMTKLTGFPFDKRNPLGHVL